MTRLRVLAAAGLLAAAMTGSGCVAGLVVAGPPPAARVEISGLAPSPLHVWIDGHWAWEGRWAWVAGRWAVPPPGRRAWMPGHWARHHRGWVWVDGYWRR